MANHFANDEQRGEWANIPDPAEPAAQPDNVAPIQNIPDPAAIEQSVPDPFVYDEQTALDAQYEQVESESEEIVESEEGFTSVFSPLQDAASAELPRSSNPVISLRNVTKIYPAQPNKPALEDVTLDIYPGEFVFLVGHSGSGKSTFLRLLTRELKATHGQVIVAGQDLTNMRNRKVPFLRRQIGCVFQDFKLLPDKTTYENVSFALECIGKPRSVIRAQVPEVLRLVGLGEKMDNYPDQLSGGEQQRVSVARAMVNRPPLLVCDEPTGNLDPAISLGIMKLLERINRAGTTVLMATHDREMVDSMRKRVIALEAGHVVRDQERGGYGYYGI
ncbi:cell division ATP-binding protein FtsE [Olsenella sp. Marseille-QA0557]|uniref:cell division ATP-binding protein FtsE n=1 Tax=Olsenella sp. Marseille-QA0557 TaxID=3378782 RepID=UPI003D0CDC99